ncbi:MAG: Superkiller protein 3 [Phylliscum demangeonii]|nr:MAG: Superkiller protein 3 [Phylliscum demangeonii]
MSTVKAALKAAKAAIDSLKYEDAVIQAEKVLAAEPDNYHANVFLGLALDKLDRPDEAARAYHAATKNRRKEPLAWQGLLNLLEKQGQHGIRPYHDAATQLAEIYMEGADQLRCETVIDKWQSHVADHGSRTQVKQALEMLLPSGPYYHFLDGRLTYPSDTYVRLAQIIEAEERERINQEIGERRTRLGARIDQVTTEVRRDVLGNSPLESIYREVINWTKDDDERREYEEKLLRHAYETLVVLPFGAKKEKRHEVEEMAKGMIIIKHAFHLAWEICLEWKDGESLDDWDEELLNDYVHFFPQEGLAKVLKGYLTSTLSPFFETGRRNLSKLDDVESPETTDKNDRELSAEARLILMTV